MVGFLFFLALLKKPKESPTILGLYPSIHCVCIHFEYINQRQIQRPKLQWSKSLIILMKVDICKVNDDHVHGFLGISPRGAVFFSLFLARLSKIKTTPGAFRKFLRYNDDFSKNLWKPISSVGIFFGSSWGYPKK